MARCRATILVGVLIGLLVSTVDALIPSWRATPSMVSGPVSTEGTTRLFVFGLGYTGLSIAKRMASKGWRVGGTVSTAEKARTLGEPGIDAYVFNSAEGPMNDPKGLEALRLSTHVLVTIAPMRGEGGGDGVLRWHRNDFAQLARLQWLGYLSSTGVYGDFQGGWVTEEDAPVPNTPVGRARLAAEQEWSSAFDPPLPLHIFRLAGIYGPGRSALDTLAKHGYDLSASGVSADDASYISRVHVDDISLVVALSMLRPSSAPVCYNVADDRPASRFEVFSFASGLVRPRRATEDDGERPSEQPTTAAPARSSRQAGSKRVSNAKMRAELLAPSEEELKYPDYVAGLTKILEDMA